MHGTYAIFEAWEFHKNHFRNGVMVIAKNAELDWPLKRARSRTPKTKLRQLESLGIKTVRDLLTYLPCKYEDRRSVVLPRDAHVGKPQTFEGYIDGVRNDGQLTPGSGRHRQSTKLLDTYGDLKAWRDGLDLLWFGQNHLTARLHRGYRIRVHGTTCIDPSNGHLALNQPEIDAVDTPGWTRPAVNTARIVPIYDLAPGMLQTYHREIVWECLEHCHQQQPERSRPGYNDHTLGNIMWALHFPQEEHHPALARSELAADEILELQMALSHLRWKRQTHGTSVPIPVTHQAADGSAGKPFALSPSQARALEKIRGDVTTRGAAMNRVLQGGRARDRMTVALRAVLDTASVNTQSVLLAPNELLAEQHLNTIAELLGADHASSPPAVLDVQVPSLWRPFVVALLTSSARVAQRRSILRSVASGYVDLVISTTAALDGSTAFRQLGLAIATEQSGLGITDRPTVAHGAHYLMMPVIPIPRSLQLTLYRDLDFSTIDPVSPPTPPQTFLVLDDDWEAAWSAMERVVRDGQQALVICPFVNPIADIPGVSVSEMRQTLAARFPNFLIGATHELMRDRTRRDEMRRFRDGQISVVVSTPEIEAGIDFPNAAIMLIASAERFGLARLDQLRGRIGHGDREGSCYLAATPGRSLSPGAIRRLEYMTGSSNGLELAEDDLRYRNRDRLAGGRQWARSGILKTGDSYNLVMVQQEHVVAEEILAQDPELKLPEHRALLAARDRMLERLQSAASGG